MQFKVKLLSFNEPASDSSRISREVVEQYLASEDYKKSIASKKMLGTLTHYSRNVVSGTKNLSSAVSKTIGKDDLMLIVGESSPTHYISELSCGNDGWLYATCELLNEENFDDDAKANIKRLKGLLSQGIMVGCSAVILGYWDSTNAGDNLRKLIQLKGLDITLNPSWKKAQVVSITDDNGNVINSIEDKLFSEIEKDELKHTNPTVKVFSDLNALGASGMAKSSKVDGRFTVLKAKEFSFNNTAEEVSVVSKSETIMEKEKDFSVSALRDRVREATRYSVRMRFRRLFIDYKQLIKQMGGADKMDPATLRTMKSLFLADINLMFTSISAEVMAGKQINTLIGASSLGKEVRMAANKMNLPFRMCLTELHKTGKITPMRFQKIKEAYTEFAQALVNEVFGNSPIPENFEKEVENEEGAE